MVAQSRDGGPATFADTAAATQVNPSSSITMRILQQKQARESQRSQEGEMNLYAPNPFGGLQAPVAGSSGESDQTYKMGARTEYGGLQNSTNVPNNNAGTRNNRIVEQNPLDTQGSNFIAVQDNTLHTEQHATPITMSPVIQTNIKHAGPHHRQSKTSDKYSGSDGRQTKQLRESVDENRKRNFVNVSHNILSPSQGGNKAGEGPRPMAGRPPSHPGPANKQSALPPKPEPTVKRTNSYVGNMNQGDNSHNRSSIGQSQTAVSKNMKIR